jgi:hypothetical protein
MSRGRPKLEIQEPSPLKFKRVYENEDMIETWIYDLMKSTNGPVEVNIKYKNGVDKKWIKMQEEHKKEKSTARKMKKINDKKK